MRIAHNTLTDTVVAKTAENVIGRTAIANFVVCHHPFDVLHSCFEFSRRCQSTMSIVEKEENMDSISLSSEDNQTPNSPNEYDRVGTIDDEGKVVRWITYEDIKIARKEA